MINIIFRSELLFFPA